MPNLINTKFAYQHLGGHLCGHCLAESISPVRVYVAPELYDPMVLTVWCRSCYKYFVGVSRPKTGLTRAGFGHVWTQITTLREIREYAKNNTHSGEGVGLYRDASGYVRLEEDHPVGKAVANYPRAALSIAIRYKDPKHEAIRHYPNTNAHAH